MDLVPRIRQPTPEKKEEKSMGPSDCDGCQRYKDKLQEVSKENRMLREELEKV
jgi:hypothetical protein